MDSGGTHWVVGIQPICEAKRAGLGARSIVYRQAPNLAALLGEIGSERCDLVLLDGLEAFDPVRAAIPADDFLPVAIEAAEPSVRVRALEAGADAVLDSALDVGEWVAHVEAILRWRRRMRQLLESKRELEKLSNTDDLTGLHNKRWLLARLTEEVCRAKRYQLGVALILMDMDHFKRINDARGHLFGDEVLVAFSEVLRQSFRSVDRVARFGGEEFAVVLPETDLAGALDAAERFRLKVESSTFAGTALTISAGVAALEPAGEGSAEFLLRQADEALYLAKRAGRNRVVAADPRAAPRLVAR